MFAPAYSTTYARAGVPRVNCSTPCSPELIPELQGLVRKEKLTLGPWQANEAVQFARRDWNYRGYGLLDY